jgi:hypothetical protein
MPVGDTALEKVGQEWIGFELGVSDPQCPMLGAGQGHQLIEKRLPLLHLEHVHGARETVKLKRITLYRVQASRYAEACHEPPN